MDNRGFAISSIVYSILILALTLMFLILANMVSRKLTIDKVRNDVKKDLGDLTVLPILQSWTSASTTDFHNNDIKSRITSVSFVEKINIPEKGPSDVSTYYWDVSAVKNGSVIAWITDNTENVNVSTNGSTGQKKGYTLYIAGNGEDGVVYANPDSSDIFHSFKNLKSITWGKFNTKYATDMSFMFYHCDKLDNLDMSTFDTSKVTTMKSMFDFCGALTNLNVSSFDTSHVTDMYAMFSNCSKLESLTITNFNTSNVENMSYMFNGMHVLTSIDVSNFDTSKVTTMHAMFNECRKLTVLDLKQFDTGAVTSMKSMFNNCIELTTINVSTTKWVIQAECDISGMFNGAKATGVTKS